LEGARLGLVRVAHDVDRLVPALRDEAHLHAGGEAGPATAADVGGLDAVHEGGAIAAGGSAQLGVAARALVLLDVLQVLGVPEHAPQHLLAHPLRGVARHGTHQTWPSAFWKPSGVALSSVMRGRTWLGSKNSRKRLFTA